jgi:hypothetical protein
MNSNSANSFAVKNSNFGLELSRMNFASKLRKASHAINNPYQPQLEQPVIVRAQKMQELIDSTLSEMQKSSPVH